MALAGKYKSFVPDVFPDQALHQQLASNASPALRQMLLNTQYPTTTQDYKQQINSLLKTLQTNPAGSAESVQAMIALSELQNEISARPLA